MYKDNYNEGDYMKMNLNKGYQKIDHIDTFNIEYTQIVKEADDFIEKAKLWS